MAEGFCRTCPAVGGTHRSGSGHRGADPASVSSPPSWGYDPAQDQFQRNRAVALTSPRANTIGTVGVIDETSCRKWGNQTPGVQRKYLGGIGKVDNGIVTVYLGVACGRFQALLDADLYWPKSWTEDRERCRAAGIPDEVPFRIKWRIARDQWIRLRGNGGSFDWLTCDEG